MKKIFSSLLLFSLLFFAGCVKEKPKTTPPKKDAFRTLNTQDTTRSANNVVCHNCRATFKLSRAVQKSSHGHNYIECPVCHQDYLKKSK